MKTVEAVKYFGSKTGLANALGISPPAVSMWGKIVPEGRAYQLQALTNGKLTVDQSAYSDRKKKADICER